MIIWFRLFQYMPICISPLQNGGIPTEKRWCNWQVNIIFVKWYLCGLKKYFSMTFTNSLLMLYQQDFQEGEIAWNKDIIFNCLDTNSILTNYFLKFQSWKRKAKQPQNISKSNSMEMYWLATSYRCLVWFVTF